MAKNKNKNNGDQTTEGDAGNNVKNNGDSAAEKSADSAAVKNTDSAAGKKADSAVVLKINMHCQGCASKIVKCVRSFKGVETVKSEFESGKLTVTGAVDPVKLIERLLKKTKKKAELISPQPKKENDKSKSVEAKPKAEEKKPENEKKPKETPATTAVLKVNCCCEGCVHNIENTVAKTKGVDVTKMDKEKKLVTVKGSGDVQKLAEKLKCTAEIVPPPQPPAKKENANANAKGKEKESGETKGKEKESGEKKGGGGKDNSGAGGSKSGEAVNQFANFAAQPGYGYYQGGEFGYPVQPGYGYGSYPGGELGYPAQSHAPQYFSDENPNACVTM